MITRMASCALKSDIMLWCHSGNLFLPLPWDFGMRYAISAVVLGNLNIWENWDSALSKEM